LQKTQGWGTHVLIWEKKEKTVDKGGPPAKMTTACAEQVYAALKLNTTVGVNGLKGGNYNFLLSGLAPDLASCSGGRCGFFNSLHFNSATNPTSVHLDTANPFVFPAGTLVHLFADYILGNTIWSSGIPR